MSTRSISEPLYRLGSRLADLFLPGSCCLCQDDVPAYRRPNVVCQACESELVQAKKCPRCSAVLKHENSLPSEDCPWCHHLKLPFENITSIGNYAGSLKEAILAAKSHRGTATAWDLGQLLASIGDLQEATSPWVVPVPMHWTRRIRRGTDTAFILAKSLAHLRKWPLKRIVACQRRLAKQSELPFSARRTNVRGAFELRGSIPPNQTIVLVDDILTTGSTLSEIGRTLRRAGLSDIRVAVVARSTPDYIDV